MFVFQKVSACVALSSMGVFTMVGCCCSGSCGLPFGKKTVAPEASSQPCSTCGDEFNYSTPAQSFTTPTLGSAAAPKSYSTQEFSTEQFSIPTQTAAAPATVTPKTAPMAVEQGTDGGGFIPRVQSSLAR